MATRLRRGTTPALCVTCTVEAEETAEYRPKTLPLFWNLSCPIYTQLLLNILLTGLHHSPVVRLPHHLPSSSSHYVHESKRQSSSLIRSLVCKFFEMVGSTRIDFSQQKGWGSFCCKKSIPVDPTFSKNLHTNLRCINKDFLFLHASAVKV